MEMEQTSNRWSWCLEKIFLARYCPKFWSAKVTGVSGEMEMETVSSTNSVSHTNSAWPPWLRMVYSFLNVLLKTFWHQTALCQPWWISTNKLQVTFWWHKLEVNHYSIRRWPLCVNPSSIMLVHFYPRGLKHKYDLSWQDPIKILSGFHIHCAILWPPLLLPLSAASCPASAKSPTVSLYFSLFSPQGFMKFIYLSFNWIHNSLN